jgi:hypothetical protein
MNCIVGIIIIALSSAGIVCSGTRPTQVFDSFGDICCDAEKARLDNFAIALQNEPEATGYIIFYGGTHQKYPWCSSKREVLPHRGESQARAARLKPYLVNSRAMDARRIIVIDGGYREAWTAELWIVPKGMQAPTPTPTVQPKDVRYRRGRVKKSHYVCEV